MTRSTFCDAAPPILRVVCRRGRVGPPPLRAPAAGAAECAERNPRGPLGPSLLRPTRRAAGARARESPSVAPGALKNGERVARAVAWVETLVRALKASALNPDLLYFAMGGIAIGGVLLATVVARHKGKGDSWFARYAQRLRSAVPALLLMSGIIFVVGLQGNFERAVQAWHGWDFTWVAWAIEGNAAERFQDHFRRPWLDGPVVAVYSAGAFLLYQVPFLCLVLLGRGRSAMRVAATLGAVWAVGIVCYFFVPVYEVWVTASPPYNWTHVENVYFDYVPEARGSYNYQTAINNNFPSLHVGASWAIAASLLLARERWLGIPAALVASGVTFATVYLGIHWFVDVAAGLALAWGAAWLVHRKLPTEEASVRLALTPAEAPGPSVQPEEAR